MRTIHITDFHMDCSIFTRPISFQHKIIFQVKSLFIQALFT